MLRSIGKQSGESVESVLKSPAVTATGGEELTQPSLEMKKASSA